MGNVPEQKPGAVGKCEPTLLQLPIHGQVVKLLLHLDAVSQRLIFDNCQGGLLYEFPSVLALNQFLKPGDTFIDVGAHIGFFTLIASVMVGPNGRVLAFEPEPHNFDALRRNVALNQAQNVMLIKAVAGDVEGQVTFYENLDNDGGHALWPPGLHPFNTRTRLSPKPSTAPQVTVDAALRRAGVKCVAAMKIDTEGAEVRVARGARECLGQPELRLVICEHNRFGLFALGATSQDLLREFYTAGFKGFVTEDGSNFQEISVDRACQPCGEWAEKFNTDRTENIFFLR